MISVKYMYDMNDVEEEYEILEELDENEDKPNDTVDEWLSPENPQYDKFTRFKNLA